jgi:hypothetical protein
VGASVPAGTYPVKITGTSGTINSSTIIGLSITAPTFKLSFQPGSLEVAGGFAASGMATITAQNGFNGNVSLAASGLPNGVTASFGSLSVAGTIQIIFSASSTATAGSFPVTLTGTSGLLTNSASFTLTVLAPTVGVSPVYFSSLPNVTALVIDGVPFAGGGLDGGLNGSSTAYSSNLIGSQQTINGTLFYFGSPNVLDAVSGKTIPLSPGQFTNLQMLATGVNGNQLAQVFKITYTDGTVSSFTQNVSDWFDPQNFPGEAKAMIMPYRDNGQGQKDNRTFYLYEYTFPLIANKSVLSITLPNNRNLVVLAASLINTAASVHH